MKRMGASDEKDPPARPRAGEGDGGRAGRLAFVTHEIRNPLSTALWTAEMLARMGSQDRGGARGEKLSAMCLRSVARVRQLVEDHFFCERLDVGGLPLRIEVIGAQEAIQAALEKRPAEIASCDIDPALGVEVDRTLLERALEALVAVAGEEGNAVTVTARAVEGQVSFVVSGRPADAAAISDPVKGSPSDPTGRALATPLARRIASALGGTLGVQKGAWVLTVPRARTYTPRPGTAAFP